MKKTKKWEEEFLNEVKRKSNLGKFEWMIESAWKKNGRKHK